MFLLEDPNSKWLAISRYCGGTGLSTGPTDGVVPSLIIIIILLKFKFNNFFKCIQPACCIANRDGLYNLQ